MHHNNKTTGTCTMCEKENCALTIVDEETRVCDECLNENFFLCEDCDEYWDYDYVDFFHLKDGRIVCEYCIEDYDEDEIEEE